jgi:hypothetical protein
LPLAIEVMGILVFRLSRLTFGGSAELVGVVLIAISGLGWAATGYVLWLDRRELQVS